jgi:hypothetical protein
MQRLRNASDHPEGEAAFKEEVPAELDVNCPNREIPRSIPLAG